MIIEVADLFVVTRGYKLGRVPVREYCDEVETIEYDRSYNGSIFRALSVEGDSIVAERVYPLREYLDSYSSSGNRVLLNSSELELSTVSEGHLKLLLEGAKK